MTWIRVFHRPLRFNCISARCSCIDERRMLPFSDVLALVRGGTDVDPKDSHINERWPTREAGSSAGCRVSTQGSEWRISGSC